MQTRNTLILVIGFLLFSATSFSKETKKHKQRNRSFYGSWGYNEEWFTNSTIHISQPGLGNDYDMVHVKAADHRGWNNGLFNEALTIPQYNYRLGCYFNENQDLAIELNFDHTKYVVNDGEDVHITGTINHAPVNEHVIFSQQNGFYYYLNNGANFFLFNLVKRLGLYHTTDNNLGIDLTGKAGVGPVIPHVQNSLFGEPNNQQFQLGGWNVGLETALRVTFLRYAYFEFSQKVDYARYSHLLVYDGRAKQNFGTYELILSVGAIIPTTPHNPMFHRQQTTDIIIQD